MANKFMEKIKSLPLHNHQENKNSEQPKPRNTEQKQTLAKEWRKGNIYTLLGGM